jgi:3-oxoacyl-[acyl-carrier protein] reductase
VSEAKEGLAVVTGASRGIGRAAALALAARGLDLVVLGRGSRESEATLAACRAAGAPSARQISVDFADLAATERGARELLDGSGAPDVVVHNAGVVHRKAVEELSVAEWQREITVNLSAPFVLTRALLPAMRRRGRGRILFVGSISSTLGTRRQSAYAASKWGIVGFMKSLAEELSDSGLMTAAVLPGSVATDMLAGSGFPPRMNAEDVARSLVYLALEAPLAQNGGVIELFGT